MAAFTIEARDGRSDARAGVLATAHGDVRTPAFVPLATKATVKGLLPAEVVALGYEMVLGNTFHLLLNPGPELIERFGGVGKFMGWDGPIVTDSGGFQVFSMGHGTVAEEIKSSHAGAGGREGAILAIEEDGVRFRSYVDGRERFLSPEGSMATQAALGSDLALVFDECTPFNVDRDYTQRSTERTHRWLERCLGWPARLRDRPGRRLRGPETRVDEHGRRERVRRDRDRRLARRGEGADVRGGRLRHARAGRRA
jgi:queuine tRNA-ribosyltransferase